jgi:hypothetical protein
MQAAQLESQRTGSAAAFFPPTRIGGQFRAKAASVSIAAGKAATRTCTGNDRCRLFEG